MTSEAARRVLELMRASQELVDGISFDMNGMLVGLHMVGGNGGLISPQTLAKADAVRRAINALKPAEENGPT